MTSATPVRERYRKPARELRPVSVEEFADGATGLFSGRPIDLHRLRTVFPDRWAGFLKKHFRNSVEIAAFFSVSEKTARLWMEGASAPRSEVILALIERNPAIVPVLRAMAA